MRACYVASLRFAGFRQFYPSAGRRLVVVDLLSSLSQLVTLPFQSQVCLSKSKASPLGHVICFRPDLVHLTGAGQKNKGCLRESKEGKRRNVAYSRADRSSSRSSSSRRSAARCRTQDRSGIAPSPASSHRSRWLCRT